MKTGHKYITFNEKRNIYVFHMVLQRDSTGFVLQQVNKTAKTLEDILMIRDEFLRLQGISIELVKEYDYATSPKKEKKIAIPTFEEGFTAWIESVIVPNVKPSSASTYYATLNKVIPFIGSIPINKVSKDLLQSMFTAIQKNDNLSKCYMLKMISIVYRYYQWEKSKGVVKDNPCMEISIMKTIPRRTVRAFTEKEKFRFLFVAKKYLGYIWYLIFYTAFQTGLRRGELLALQWKDIDLVKGYIHVTKAVSVDKVNGGEYISTTKTDSSKRIVPIRKNLIDSFKLLSRGKDKEDFVFTIKECKRKTKGEWISTTRISQNFSICRELAHLPNDLTLHSTRKTFASELLLKGVDIVTVKKLGGWISTNILLKHYAFSDIEHMTKAIRG
jgi:hypothetical protein